MAVLVPVVDTRLLSATVAVLAALPSLALVTGCGAPRMPASASPQPPPRPPAPLTTPEIVALIPHQVRDRDGWGEAIANALAANELLLERTSACAVIAVIGQESGFAADPAVPGLAAIAAARIDREKARLGPFGDPVFDRLLSGRAPDDARSFRERVAGLRTERDADVLFRDLLAYYQVNHPVLFGAAEWAGKLTDLDGLAGLNPITTAGSMQVSVRFAEEWARAHKGETATPGSVRDALYTRAGGVYYGTARLLAYPARYDRLLFRFADYNAGLYASRNAAVQAALSWLTGRRLALDGDLLSYDRGGKPTEQESESERAVQAFARRHAPRLSAGAIRRDLLGEKTIGFEQTETYLAIKTVTAQKLGQPPSYATLPQVTVTSPKLRGTRSTAWFAQSVDRRYQTCVGTPGR
ncbi:MAG TPA: DUF1615 family protein [Polyangia bacterium]|nr:DUF1615 family protein [Polyangia bacterium]